MGLTIIVVLALVLLLYMKLVRGAQISWWLIGGVALVLAGILTDWFGIGGSGGPNTNDPLQIDSCGCGPGQSVAMSKLGPLGFTWRKAGIYPCDQALSRLNNRRWRIDGCIN